MSQLQFKSIVMENFKTFSGEHRFDIARKPGLYYITGNNKLEPELGANGVGKSTIWDALTWVLWGKTGRDNRPAEAIRPWFGKGKTHVSLTFERGPTRWTISRDRSPNRLGIQEGGHDTPLSNYREIQQEQVPKLLGMSEEMFRRTLVLSQGGAMFLDLRPEAQAQMFTEALQLDVWLRAIDAAAQAVKDNQRKADQAAAAQQTTDAALATVASDINEFILQAETFDTDQRQRIQKGKAGIMQLEQDLIDAKADPVPKPDAPSAAILNKLKDERAPLRQDIAILQKDIERSRREHKDLIAQVNAAKAPKGKLPNCPTCGKPMTATAAVDHVDKLLAKVEAEETVISQQEAETQDLQRRADALTVKIDKAQKDYDQAIKTFDSRMTAWEAYTRKIASINGELSRWKANLQSVQAETNRAAAEVDRLKKRRSALRIQATDNKQALEEALAAIEAAKFWVDGFREIRLSIIDQTLVELEMAASRHAAMLGLNDWGIKFDTERETKSGTVSYAFSVLLYPPGKDEPVKWESYSGGEGQRWQLAVAFGLSEVLLARAGLSPNMEVLDEPTKGLSPLGVSDLLDHLRDRALELGRAIYFVDHHSLDKGAFDGTLMVTKTKTGSSFKWI